MFYKVVEEFSDIIENYSVSQFKRYGSAVSLIADVKFTNGSILHIKDYLFQNGKRKYSFHWQDADGGLISRWDNSYHHREVITFPHHKHCRQGKVTLSRERNIRDIFRVIREEIYKTSKS